MKKFILLTICLLVSFTAYSQITSAQNGNWSAEATWVGGSVPGASDAVVIAHDVSCASTQSASTLTVNSGNTLTVTKDGALTIVGAVSNSGSIVVVGAQSESGSLIATSASAFTLSFDLYIPQSQWKLVGIPVSGEVVGDIDDNLATNTVGGVNKIGLGYWNTTSSSWTVLSASATGDGLSQTRGYEMIHSSGDVVRFTGNLRADSRSTVGTLSNRWTLLGNPYPSYLRLTDDASGASGSNFFLNSTHLGYLKNTHQAIYGWDGSAYDTYSNDTGPLDIMMPGDGFFVYGNDEDQFNFTESMQVHDGGAGFRGSAAQGATGDFENRLASIKFIVSDEFGTNKYLTVKFGDKYSLGLDPGADLGAFAYGKSHIYTQLAEGYENIDFTVQSLPYEKLDDMVVSVGVKSPIGTMKLNYKENSIPDYIDMYLEDTQENTFKKITDGFEINFDQAYEGLGRFYLHFTDEIIPELPTDDNLRIYKGSDSDVMVMGAVGKNYSAKVYDYSGRLIKEVNFNHKTKINDLDSKMKILRIESEEGLTIKKFKLN